MQTSVNASGAAGKRPADTVREHLMRYIGPFTAKNAVQMVSKHAESDRFEARAAFTKLSISGLPTISSMRLRTSIRFFIRTSPVAIVESIAGRQQISVKGM